MTDKLQNARQLCLSQAQGFIDAAECLIDENCRHVVYHLSLLALEEVGKASLISVQIVGAARGDDSVFERWLDSHTRKLQWAIWTPMVDRIDPKDFEDARTFAESAHAKRLASLYVDSKAAIADLPPPEQVSKDDADLVLKLAKSRLEVERAHGTPTGKLDDLTEWFLDTMGDRQQSRRLLSNRFIEKFGEYKGDVRSWVNWSRQEFARLDREASDLLKAELARPAAKKGEAKPKWRANSVVYSPSHSLRSKVLAQWNEKMDWIKLLWTGKKDEFTVQITLHDNEPLPTLPGRLISLAKLTVACLNMGTIGYFWFERSGFERKMFKEVVDLEGNKPMSMEGGQSFWETGRTVALTNEHIDHALHCMMAYAPLPEAEAEPIFSPYFHGLALIAKSDLFYNFDQLARRAFCDSLCGALRHFGGWSGKNEDFEASFHAGFQPFIPEIEHRTQMLRVLTFKGDPAESSLANLRAAKQLTDLYLVHTARKTWQRILK